jgi:hypothetical protein
MRSAQVAMSFRFHSPDAPEATLVVLEVVAGVR